jgi:hypothetical protein
MQVTERQGDDFGPQGLAASTLLPTPNGWTTLEEIQPGDMLYDERGLIRHILAKSQIRRSRLAFRVVFRDGEKIVAAPAHRWAVTEANHHGRHKPSVLLTTQTLYERSLRVPGNTFSTGLQPVLEAARSSLPLDPYLLGYWLGDGTKGTSAIACQTADIPELAQTARRLGFGFSHPGGYVCSVKGLAPRLAAIGVLVQKHVPAPYLRASVEDRLALLAGLVDTDGSSASSHQNRRNAFYNSNLALLDSVQELVWSLGGKSSRRLISKAGQVYPAIAPSVKPIVQRHDQYAVSFVVPFITFRLTRKTSHQQLASIRQRQRIIAVIEPCGDVETLCLQVDSPSDLILCGRSMVATHGGVRFSLT